MNKIQLKTIMESEIIKQYCSQIMGGEEKPKGKIVMLLGSGFSVDKGYPTGGSLNDSIAKLDKDQFRFDYCGGIVSTKGRKISVYDISCDMDDINNLAYYFLVEALHHYIEKVGKDNFNYEDFYDIIDVDRIVERKDNILSHEYRLKAEKYVDISDELEYRQLIHRLPILYNQIIAFFLKERNGQSFYDDVTCDIKTGYTSYSNFLDYLIMSSKTNIIDVFTLNHDMLFESFNRVKGLEGIISDGFDEYGSNYYALMRIDGCDYRCRLERYTGKYLSRIRLYKLHGSLDYVPYFKTIKTKTIPYAVPQNYIKLKKGISPFNISKSLGCKRHYEESLYPYSHADFLSGTKVKIQKYKNKYLYTKLHKRFRNALRNADMLIIMGYGAKDKKIEEQIFLNYDYKNKKTYIIDYDPKKEVEKLRSDLHAELLIGTINDQIKRINSNMESDFENSEK